MTRYARIIGTGSYLPPKRVTNQELAAQLAEKGIETNDEWIVTRSGIRARHFAEPDVTCSDLAVKAAERAIEAAGIDRSEIDLILVATSTPDFVFPSTACLVQQKLGITNGCAAFDVQAVCSGFVYALSTADNFIRSGAYRNVLVIGSEVFSRIIDFNDRTTCVLFGDGAGAVVLQASDEPGILSTALHADGSHANILCVPGNVAGQSARQRLFVDLEVEGVVWLQCQRCLHAYEQSLLVRTRLEVMRSEEEADAAPLDDDEADVIVGSRSFDLITQIEDELLLALPVSPRHAVCPDEVLPEEAEAEKKPSPFAVLANLKTKH